jgi:hypothetical protein
MNIRERFLSIMVKITETTPKPVLNHHNKSMFLAHETTILPQIAI